VTHLVHPWQRPVLRVLLLVAAVAAAPVPCMAEQAPPPAAPGGGVKASLERAIASEVGTLRPVARAQQTPATDLGSRSFFKSPAGIITLVVVGAGLGFALYSTNHDRVESPHVSYEGGVR
jgi:hypothetical protein